MSSNTLAAVLRAAPATTAPAARGLLMAALVPTAAAVLSFATWAALAPMAGAVIAPAEVRVELNRKAVAHAEGGIVREILVREGQAVKAGDALVVVGDTKTDAALKLLQDQQRAARARIARAEAEAAAQPHVTWPAVLAADPAAAEPVAREQALFNARRRALDEQAASLRQQAAQAQQQARALQGQIGSTQSSAQLSNEELAMNERLADQGYVHRSRLIGLARTSTDYAARLAEQQGSLAAVQQRSGEIGARLAELQLSAQAQAADELRQATASLREIEERLAPSRDQAERQTVRALADGTVMNLKLAAAGTVVAPRELLLEIVPSQEKLVVDARFAPQDVEQLRAGGAAEVKLLGSAWHRAAPLPARVARIAPDRSSDAASGKTWFAAVVEVDAAALKAAGVRELQPGLPAEVYVTTGARSLLQYLAAPLDLFTRRAMRES